MPLWEPEPPLSMGQLWNFDQTYEFVCRAEFGGEGSRDVYRVKLGCEVQAKIPDGGHGQMVRLREGMLFRWCRIGQWWAVPVELHGRVLTAGEVGTPAGEEASAKPPAAAHQAPPPAPGLPATLMGYPMVYSREVPSLRDPESSGPPVVQESWDDYLARVRQLLEGRGMPKTVDEVAMVSDGDVEKALNHLAPDMVVDGGEGRGSHDP